MFCIFDLIFFFLGGGGGGGVYNARSAVCFVFLIRILSGGGLLYNERFIIDTIDNYRSILSTSFLIFQSYHKVVEVMASNQKVAVVYCDLV